MDFDISKEIDLSVVQDMFREESVEMLKRGEKALLALEKTPENKNLIGTIFRCAHSIKGCARVAGYNRIAEFTHGFEDLLEMVKKGQVTITPDLISFLLQFLDALNILVHATEIGEPELEKSHWDLLNRLQDWFGTKENVKDRPTEAAESAKGFGSLENTGYLSDKSLVDRRARTIRVPVERLDELMNLVGEISIARGQITDMLEGENHTESAYLLETHRESDLLYTGLQELSMKLRTVPITPLFEEFYRPIRDLSLKCNKQVQLAISGEGAEVDTTVVEYLRDPLIHMIRNAVYHGIENPDERISNGKSPVGTITLSAAREAGRIRVVVEDDGAGFDRERISCIAVQRGLIPSGHELRDTELYQMIFMPGFTTAKEKNEISGRGVGMDVVRRNLEALRGRIRVESTKGEGTRFILTMPLTLAIIDGFRVSVGKEMYVIPLESVRECVELPTVDKESTAKWGVTKLRGKPLPFIYLKRLFKLECPSFVRENLIVIGYGDKQAGIVVDQLLGEAQTVIKPLGKPFQDIAGITGSTILGNGRVAFVLDVASMVTTAIEEMENAASIGNEDQINQEPSSALRFGR